MPRLLYRQQKRVAATAALRLSPYPCGAVVRYTIHVMIENGTPVAFTSGTYYGLGRVEDTTSIGGRGAYEVRVTISDHYAPGVLVLVHKEEVYAA